MKEKVRIVEEKAKEGCRDACCDKPVEAQQRIVEEKAKGGCRDACCDKSVEVQRRIVEENTKEGCRDKNYNRVGPPFSVVASGHCEKTHNDTFSDVLRQGLSDRIKGILVKSLAVQAILQHVLPKPVRWSGT